MILRRLGNKSKIADKIIKYFPDHSIYIELFFGAGGMFFNKKQVQYNYLNDIDSEVYNVFNVLMNDKESLHKYIEFIPVGHDFWNECKKGVYKDNIQRAVYFLTLSNFGFMGQPQTLRIGQYNTKKILLENIEKTYLELVKNGNHFLNCDFRDVLGKISFRDNKNKAFIYSDPPYLDCTNNYNMENKWNEQDVKDCFNITFKSGINAAMSEFDHPFILEQAKEHNLNVINVGERRNLGNRRTEILITNYIPDFSPNKLIF